MRAPSPVAALLWMLTLVGGSAMAADPSWRPSGPVGLGATQDLAVDGRRIAVIDDAGAVWVSDDDGRTWSRRLPPRDDAGGFSREDVRLDAQVRLEELVDDVVDDLDASGGLQGDDSEEALEEALSAEADAASEATSALQDDLQADALDDGFFSQVAGTGGRRLRARVAWEDGALRVARGDGLWAITEDGSSSRLLVGATTAIGTVPGGWEIVGTPAGLRLRRGPRADWEIAEGGPPGLIVDVVHEGGPDVLVGADDGVWRVDVEGESRRIMSLPDVVGVATDGEHAWVSDGVRLWRLDPTASVPVSLPAVDPIVDLDVEGGVLRVATTRSVWTRLADAPDGEWTRLAVERGIETQVVALGGPVDAPWIATGRGVFAWRVGDRRGEVADNFVPTNLLLSASLNQAGLRARVGTGRSTQALRWLVPQVVFELRAVDPRTVSSRLDVGRFLNTQRDMGWFVRAVWQPPARQVAVVDPENLVVEVDEDGTQVFSGAFDDGVLIARQSRSAVREGSRRAARIVELVQQRAELLANRQEAEGDDLRARVRLELRIEEIEATLDALTNGAVGTWRAAQAAGGRG